MTDEEIKEKIKQRRTQMLVHSCIYYELNDNIVPDADIKLFITASIKTRTQRRYKELRSLKKKVT